MINRKTFQVFCDHLKKRISDGQTLTEDSVRYTFFYALTQTEKIDQSHVILEEPHPELLGKEIDMRIMHENGSNTYVELKYHRQRKSTLAMPMLAGGLFKDFNRLVLLNSPNAFRYVVYLTDARMASYFAKQSVNYSNFWDLIEDDHFLFDQSFIDKTCDTFKKSSEKLTPSKIKLLFSEKFETGHHVKIWQIIENPIKQFSVETPSASFAA